MSNAGTQIPVTNDLCIWWELYMRHMADDGLRKGFDKLCGAIDALYASLEKENEGLRKCVRSQRKQLADVQDALERRNKGELKARWQRELDALRSELDAYKVRSKLLPVDEDGVPVCVGDTLGWPDGSGTFEVVGIGDNGTLFYVGDNGDIEWTNVTGKRHVEPDTWERIIADACGGTASEQSLIARCKALANERS